MAKCLHKKKLSEEEQKFITNFSLGVYGNINVESLKAEIEKQVFAKNFFAHKCYSVVFRFHESIQKDGPHPDLPHKVINSP